MDLKAVRAALEALDPESRRLLEAMAVLGRGARPEGLLAILNPRRDPAGLTLGRISTHLEALRRMDLVRIRQGFHTLQPLPLEVAAREAWRQGRFAGLHAAVAAGHPGLAWDQEASLLADLRGALFAGDAAKLTECRSRLGTLHGSRGGATERDPLVRMLREPFEAWVLEALPKPVASEAHLLLAQDLLLSPTDARSAKDWLLARPPSKEGWEAARALLWAAEGHADEARRALARLSGLAEPLASCLQALLALGEGKAAEAADACLAALKAARKLTGKKNLLLPFPADLVWGLALLARRSALDLPILQERLERLGTLEPRDPRRALGEALASLATAVWPEALPERRKTWIPTEGAHPLQSVLPLLGKAWTRNTVDRAALRRTLEALRGTPWGIFRRAMERLEDRQGGRAAPDPLLDLVRTTEPWERALEALEALAPPPQVKEEAPLRSRRLVWRLQPNDHGVALEPWEQKADAKGGWLKAKKLSLRRCFEEPATVAEDLLPQDRAALACLKRDRTWTSDIGFEQPKALLALVGHPTLRWACSLGEDGDPVDLLRGSFRVAVEATQAGLTMRLVPPLPASDCLIQEEGKGRVRVFPVEPHHRRLQAVLGRGLTIPEAGRARALKTLGALAPLVPIHSEAGLDEDAALAAGLEHRAGDPTLNLALTPEGEGLRIAAFVQPLPDGPRLRPGHGAASLSLESAGKRVLVRRDLGDEGTRLKALVEAVPLLGPEGLETARWTLGDAEDTLELLLALEPHRHRVNLHWPKGKPMEAPLLAEDAHLRLTLTRQGAWFEASGALRLAEDRVLELRELLKLTEGVKGRFVKLDDGRYLALEDCFRARLKVLQAHLWMGKRGLQVSPFAAPALEAAVEGIGAFEADAAWQADALRIRRALDREPELPADFEGELRPYQLEGFRWLARLGEAGLGACLADDMGLGKTVQILALLLHRARRGPALVVAPTSVIGNWMREAPRFAPRLRVRRYGDGDRETCLREAGPCDLVLASYGLVQQDSARFQERDWTTLVLDEAQAVKNPETQRHKAIAGLRADFRLAASGTPVENHLLELWALFDILCPGLLGKKELFQGRFQRPIELTGDRRAQAALRQVVRPFLLRRTKGEVLPDLPSRTEILREVELSEGEAALLEALRRESLEALEALEPTQRPMQILAALTRLRRACCHPALVAPEAGLGSAKHEVLMELVEELRDNRHRALVFSQFVDHLSLVRRRLDAAKIPYQYLDGATPPKQRDAAVAAFQRGEGDLFLISLKAGGTGLNLTAADYVIHLDPWWNPAVEDQASDRAHRIGQTRPVTIYRLVAKGTVEARIVELHHRKRELADGLLAEAHEAVRLDPEALLGLLRL